MTNIGTQTDMAKQKKSLHPLAVGVTGLVLGAAGVAAIALQDEQTRKRATKKAKQVKSDLQKWGSQKLDQMKSKEDSAQELLDERKETEI